MDCKRLYVRCTECLFIAALEEPCRGNVLCGICGGALQTIGQVHPKWRNRIVTGEDTRPACDGRCTGATGPSCDCQCEGENHGTGRVVHIEIVDDVPRLSKPKDSDKYLAMRDEYWNERLELNALFARSKYGRLLNAYLQGTFLTGKDWEDCQRATILKTHLKEASSSKSHSGRMKKLAKVRSVLEQGEE